jgi:hypothetical protein
MRQPRGWPQTQGGSSEMSRPIPREKTPIETATASRGATNGRVNPAEINSVLIEDELIGEEEEADEVTEPAEPSLVPAVDDLAPTSSLSTNCSMRSRIRRRIL